MGTQPPQDAYGRVTDPERYRPLHSAARSTLIDLRSTFDVERSEGESADPELATLSSSVDQVVRLSPRVGAAALTVALTGFPGLHVRYGEWHVESYPHCGCDACDEDVADLIDEFRASVAMLVAGSFSEWFDGSRVHFEMISGDSSHSGSRLVPEDEGSLMGQPKRYDWSPWPRRHDG